MAGEVELRRWGGGGPRSLGGTALPHRIPWTSALSCPVSDPLWPPRKQHGWASWRREQSLPLGSPRYPRVRARARAVGQEQEARGRSLPAFTEAIRGFLCPPPAREETLGLQERKGQWVQHPGLPADGPGPSPHPLRPHVSGSSAGWRLTGLLSTVSWAPLHVLTWSPAGASLLGG